MNATTKLALAYLAMLAAGLALVVAGLWPHYRTAAVIVGVLAAIAAPQLFCSLWRNR